MRAIAALSALVVVLLWAPTPAAAHGGKIKLEVAGDGATGITVRALYQSDGHPVEDRDLRLVLTATGEGGQTAGPLDLEKSPEGRAFYRTGGVLAPGRWTVVVTGADPNVLPAESVVEARAQAAPAVPSSAGPASSVAPDRPAASDEQSGGGVWWSVAFVAALAATAWVILKNRRRR